MHSYTRGGPITWVEARRLVETGHFIWHSHGGDLWTIDRLEDDHLLNIERFLLGRGDLKIYDSHRRDEERWRRTYNTIRDEIDRRGLELKKEDGAPPKPDVEELQHWHPR